MANCANNNQQAILSSPQAIPINAQLGDVCKSKQFQLYKIHKMGMLEAGHTFACGVAELDHCLLPLLD